MTTKSILTHLGMSALLAASGLAAAPAPVPPNILFILVDDLGWGDVSYHGSRIPTPHLDRLASEGVELNRHYVYPQCNPTRASLMSGVWASRYDATHSRSGEADGFPPGFRLMPEVLRDAGYTTLIVGKWHIGHSEGARPWERGFEQTYGSLHGTIPSWRHSGKVGADGDFWQRNGQPLTEEGTHTTDLLTNQAIKWIREQSGKHKPWFLYLAHFAPHTPLSPPEDWLAKFSDVKFDADPAEDARARRYAATVAHLDDAIGRTIAALKETGHSENTLVVFSSDNGPQIVHDKPAINGGSAGELRGHKTTTYEGGIRVPAFVWWPGCLKPGKLEAPVFVVDWLPTFAALTGATPPAAQKLDGTDIMPLLTGKAPAPQRILYLKYLDGMAALHDGDWKLVTRGTGNFSRTHMRGADRGDQLFNISQDPCERHDLAQTHPEILARMQALLIEQMRGDSPTFHDGNLQYWWSRVPEQMRLIEQRTAEAMKGRGAEKTKPAEE